MSEIKKYPLGETDEGKLLTIASGPVVFEDGKVLLDKHGEDNFWKFPGGKINDGESFQAVALREGKEELSLDLELIGEPFILRVDRPDELIILVHYFARRTSDSLKMGRDVREFGWFELDNLPPDCAPNIEPVIRHFQRQKR